MGEAVAAAEDNQEGEATAFIPTLHALRPAGRRGAQSLSFYAQGRLTDEPRSDSHFVFDAEASRWVRRPSINSSPALASGLYVFARLNDTLYVIGGVDNRVSPSSAVRRLDGDAWVDCAPLNRPRFAPSVCAVPNGLAVLGGFSGGGDGGEEGLEATLTTERYDARSNTWTNGPNLVFFGHEGDVLTAAIGDDVFALEAHYVSGAAGAAPALARRRNRALRVSLRQSPPTRRRSRERRAADLFHQCAARGPEAESPARDGWFDRQRRRGDVVARHHTRLRRRELDAWSPLIHLEHPALGFTALRHGDRVFFPLRGEPANGRETTAIGCLDLETDEWRRVGGSTATA